MYIIPDSRVDDEALVSRVRQADGLSSRGVDDGHRLQLLAMAAQETGTCHLETHTGQLRGFEIGVFW